MVRSFKDSLSVLKFKLLSRIRYFLNIKSKTIYPPNDYKLVFEDNFNNLNKTNWGIGSPWGCGVYNNFSYWGDTEDFIRITYNTLILESHNKPKEFDGVIHNIGMGAIFTHQNWHYGWFEIEATLPKEKNIWPAIWLTGVNTWPPEIDLVEGYSDAGECMLSDNHKHEDWRLQPNIHFGVVADGTKDFYRAENHPIKNATNQYVKYICHWTKDFIDIFYDGHKILRTTNPKILKWFNGEKDSMLIILNNAVCNENATDSTFRIKSVKVFQK